MGAGLFLFDECLVLARDATHAGVDVLDVILHRGDHVFEGEFALVKMKSICLIVVFDSVERGLVSILEDAIKVGVLWIFRDFRVGVAVLLRWRVAELISLFLYLLYLYLSLRLVGLYLFVYVF